MDTIDRGKDINKKKPDFVTEMQTDRVAYRQIKLLRISDPKVIKRKSYSFLQNKVFNS